MVREPLTRTFSRAHQSEIAELTGWAPSGPRHFITLISETGCGACEAKSGSSTRDPARDLGKQRDHSFGAQLILPDGQITSCFPKWRVQPLLQKYFCFRPRQISSLIRTVSSHSRGVSRSSRTRGGMRWTRQRQAMSGDGRAGRQGP